MHSPGHDSVVSSVTVSRDVEQLPSGHQATIWTITKNSGNASPENNQTNTENSIVFRQHSVDKKPQSLQIPGCNRWGLGSASSAGGSMDGGSGFPCEGPALFVEDEADHLLSLVDRLSLSLGLRRCFSLSDIVAVINRRNKTADEKLMSIGGSRSSNKGFVRRALSDLTLDTTDLHLAKLGLPIDCLGLSCRDKSAANAAGLLGVASQGIDAASRSYSMFVAVGDFSSASQLPSPGQSQIREPSLSLLPTAAAASDDDRSDAGSKRVSGFEMQDSHVTITPADFVRSMNKRVRQGYIGRRLWSTFRSAGGDTSPGATSFTSRPISRDIFRLLRSVTPFSLSTKPPQEPTAANLNTSPGEKQQLREGGGDVSVKKLADKLQVTAKDIERERGKPLTKFDRNLMIFNWLHTLEREEGDVGAFSEGKLVVDISVSPKIQLVDQVTRT